MTSTSASPSTTTAATPEAAESTASATLSRFTDLLTAARHSAVHLEMRDAYDVGDPYFRAWQAGEEFDRSERDAMWQGILSSPIAGGVVVRRARIVSEPVTDYIRYEHSVTDGCNIAAGEQVAWLPRGQASDLALPGNDFWLFDGTTVIFNLFTGDGQWVGDDLSTDPAVAKLCESAFEAVWDRAIPHREYRLA